MYPKKTVRTALLSLASLYCDRLFTLEREFKNLSLEQRFKGRMKSSKPLMEELVVWADSCKAAPKSAVGNAVYYAMSQRKDLEKYPMDSRLEISNNRAERRIKPFIIGRKNWLFANTPRGAKASAVIYSIIETAKESDRDPLSI